MSVINPEKTSDFDLNNFNHKPAIYLIKLTDVDYKFGRSGKLVERVMTHFADFKKYKCEPRIVRLWECRTMDIMYTVEGMIKTYGWQNGILVNKFGKKEILSTDDIESVLKRVCEYIEKMNREDEMKGSILELELERERTKQLQLELDILKLKYKLQKKGRDVIKVELRNNDSEQRVLDIEIKEDVINTNNEYFQNINNEDRKIDVAKDWVKKRNIRPNTETKKIYDEFVEYMKEGGKIPIHVGKFNGLVEKEYGYTRLRVDGYMTWIK